MKSEERNINHAAGSNAADVKEKISSGDTRGKARVYKAIRVPFNQFEYEMLDEMSKENNRSKLNMIRHALLFYYKSSMN